MNEFLRGTEDSLEGLYREGLQEECTEASSREAGTTGMPWGGGKQMIPLICCVVAVLLSVAGLIVFQSIRKRRAEPEDVPEKAKQPEPEENGSKEPEKTEAPPVKTERTEQAGMKTESDRRSSSVGKLHNIGRRKDQQDSFGVADTAAGRFAVVADGMGGLSDGDKVSQKVVMTLLKDAARLRENPGDEALFEMVSHASSEVNRMLGASGQYKSGSTLVAALAGKSYFHWVSVGDSRICLYRNKRLIQLNREHTYEADLLVQAVNGEISFENAKTHPKRSGLTSFIGMGELKHVDGSRSGIRIQEGDRLFLMSDGVFHTLSEEAICRIAETAGSAERIAAVMEEKILLSGKPKQDNFTAVILDL